MKRALSLLFMLLLLFPGFITAQEEDEEESPEERPGSPPIESEWENFDATFYSPGDKTFTMSLGLIFPTYLTGKDIENNQHGLSIGGTGTLAFNYFLTSHFFVGAELSGMFSGTRGGNMLYIIPMGLRAGVQFTMRRLEFPISVMAGLAPQRYLENAYFGLIFKGGFSVYWRAFPDWSFGLNTDWWFVPQWPKNGYNAYGNFIDLTLSARYHF